MKDSKKIAITGGGGQIAYSILFRIAEGGLLGHEQPIELRILEIPEAKKTLDGVVMELEDCAFPLVTKIVASTDPYEIFENAQIALLIGAKPRAPGMERSDLLVENAKIFIEQGKALNEKAASDILVFVVGNPCNTNAWITMQNAPKIDRSRFFAMTRLDQNRAKALLAKRSGAPVREIKQMTIWGNHSSTQVPDFTHVKIAGKPAEEVIQDRRWLETEFIETVQKRGTAVLEARGKSSAASAANAAINSICSLMQPTPDGEWFSVGICSDGNPYGVEENLIFSFPCRSKGNGQIEIVSGLEIDPFIKEKIEASEKELIQERG